MYFDGSRSSFQRLLVCCIQRHYVHVRTSTYYYVCLRTYMDYVLVRTYTILCTYVCLRVTTLVYERSRTTFIYVSIRSNMQICAYTYLFGSFFIYTYNIRIPLPIYTYQYGYIRVIRIYVQIRTTK